MPFTNRPEQAKITEGHTSIDAFLKDIMRVMDSMKPYGIYVVLFDKSTDKAHGYQFGLNECDFEVVGMIADEHEELNNKEG